MHCSDSTAAIGKLAVPQSGIKRALTSGEVQAPLPCAADSGRSRQSRTLRPCHLTSYAAGDDDLAAPAAFQQGVGSAHGVEYAVHVCCKDVPPILLSGVLWQLHMQGHPKGEGRRCSELTLQHHAAGAEEASVLAQVVHCLACVVYSCAAASCRAQQAGGVVCVWPCIDPADLHLAEDACVGNQHLQVPMLAAAGTAAATHNSLVIHEPAVGSWVSSSSNTCPASVCCVSQHAQ